MRNRSSWMLPLAIAAAMSLALAGCGDDDDTSSGDSPEDAVEDAAADAIESSLGSDCGFLAEMALTGFDSALDPTAALTDPDVNASYDALADQLREVADAAPDEIQDSFHRMADGFEAMSEALADIDVSDPSSIDPSAFEAFDDLDMDEFGEAAEEIDAWMTENCAADD